MKRLLLRCAEPEKIRGSRKKDKKSDPKSAPVVSIPYCCYLPVLTKFGRYHCTGPGQLNTNINFDLFTIAFLKGAGQTSIFTAQRKNHGLKAKALDLLHQPKVTGSPHSPPPLRLRPAHASPRGEGERE